MQEQIDTAIFSRRRKQRAAPPLPDLPPTGTPSGEKLPLRNATLPTAQTGKDHYIHYCMSARKVLSLHMQHLSELRTVVTLRAPRTNKSGADSLLMDIVYYS